VRFVALSMGGAELFMCAFVGTRLLPMCFVVLRSVFMGVCLGLHDGR
jgi:hypothetical protein